MTTTLNYVEKEIFIKQLKTSVNNSFLLKSDTFEISTNFQLLDVEYNNNSLVSIWIKLLENKQFAAKFLSNHPIIDLMRSFVCLDVYDGEKTIRAEPTYSMFVSRIDNHTGISKFKKNIYSKLESDEIAVCLLLSDSHLIH